MFNTVQRIVLKEDIRMGQFETICKILNAVECGMLSEKYYTDEIKAFKELFSN